MSAQQNLVPNGSFEDTVHCPQGADIYNAKFFSSPNNATPDYFNSCALVSNNLSTPLNGLGYQVPHTGNAYGGIVAYGYGSNYKEYIQTSLLSTLEKGKFYFVEYYVCLGNFAPVACNNFGILFSHGNKYQNTYTTLNYPEAITSGIIINDTLNWIKVNFYYTAKGDENYLILGNFKDDSETDTITNIGGASDNYYYMDDISVTKIDYQIPNVFTPNADNANDVFYFNTEIIKATQLIIYNRWGLKMFESKNSFSWDGRTTSGEACNAGSYYYIIQTETETYKGFLELVR
jgi:OOP family OmpA-OmpF porin